MKYTIIGAGIGGLTLCIGLQKYGIDATIYERFEDIREVGAGIWLSPNALQVLEYLDVLDEVKAHGNFIKHITIGKPDLTPIVDNPQNKIEERFGYTSIAIHRAKLQQILINKIEEGRLELGKTFDSYITPNDTKIVTNFTDGSSVDSDILIGADGINSAVRNQLFPFSSTRYSGQTCWRGVASVQLDEKFDHRVYEVWGNKIRIGFSKISDGKYYWFAVALAYPNQKDDPHSVKPVLLDKFREFHPVVSQLISNTPEDKLTRNDINDLNPMSKWYEGRVCLIGDAGHATTPNMGQGGAQAIEDAYYLSHYQSLEPNANVFEKFQSRRQKKVDMVVRQSLQTGKMAHWKYGKRLRNFVLSRMPKELFEFKMIEMYTIDKW